MPGEETRTKTARSRRGFLKAAALSAAAAIIATGVAVGQGPSPSAAAQTLRIERLLDGPIITPDMDGRMGSNIAGPSLIRVPDWVEHPLGRYYLYFADHRGLYIRLAYADDLAGPWTMHEPGTLQIEQSHFPPPARRAAPTRRTRRGRTPTWRRPTCTSSTSGRRS